MANDNEGLLFADGFDEAILGIARQFTSMEAVAYDREKCIEILCKAGPGMAREEAEEFFQFNTEGAWVGPHTPVFVEMMTKEQIDEYAEEV